MRFKALTLIFRVAAVVAAVSGGAAVAAGPAAAASPDLTLKRVMLSTGGVGYFEYEARVSGDAALSLTVRRDQVDDVLKSLVVYDDRGGIGTVSLPGRTPLQELFRELPFTPDALKAPAALLTALRGAELQLSGARGLSGRLVAVTEETVQLPDRAGTVGRHRLSLMTADGLRQAILEEVEAVRFADPKLQAQVETALAALAEHSERDRRTLTLHTMAGSGGPGERTVRVAYVVAAPLWKTAYRLTLGGADQTSGGLQGWAVLENLSGEDWNGVDLTVVSGNPVTFRQALYDAYYVTRPSVPVEVLGRILPKVDAGSVAAARPAAMKAPAPAAAARTAAPGAGVSTRSFKMAAEAAPAPPPAVVAMPEAEPAGEAPEHLASLTAAEAGEATTQVTFHYPGPVTVASGHSLLLPIVNRVLPAVALALYQPTTQQRHPLAAVRLSNDGATSLPPGILTLYQRGADGMVSYVGDARLAALPAGQDRLLSFAVDQKVTIDRADTPSQTLSQARIAGGVFQLVTTERATSRYTIAGAAFEPRRLVIEHPRQEGWALAAGTAGGAAVEATADAWRIAAEVPAGKTVTLEITAERPSQDRFQLLDLSSEQLVFYAGAGALPAELRKALARITELRAVVDKQAERVSQLEQERETITQDQARLRDNLHAVGQGSDLSRRYLAKLNEQEDRLDRQAKDLATAQAAEAAAQQALADFVKGLKL